MGYVILPTGEVDFDPDEQAREVIQLIFDKFDELGTIYGAVSLADPPRHPAAGPARNREPRRGNWTGAGHRICTLGEVLAHPIYAGAYSFGRQSADPKRKFSPSSNIGRGCRWSSGKSCIKDRLPAYITWERYLKNRERIKQNRNTSDAPGVPRAGRRCCLRCPGVRSMQPSYAAVLSQGWPTTLAIASIWKRAANTVTV